MKTFLYKARKSLFSGFLVSASIGWCYAFSLFAPHVASALSVSMTAVQFAFCLNIFFLGMGAAFFGKVVEKNIKKAAWTSAVLLCLGLCVAGMAMHVSSILLFYVGVGVLAGLAEGVGYVTPVKNLLLFFGKSKHKALVMALSIVSFGLGSSICSFIFRYAFPAFGIENVMFFFAGLYAIVMTAAALMIDKPRFAKIKAKKAKSKKFSFSKYAKDSYFWQCWLFMLLNISMGLIIIGRCASMLAANGMQTDMVLFVMMVCGLSNGLGRLVFPAISDYMRSKATCWMTALIIEIIALAMSIFDPILIPFAFVLINACYGCGFALCPAVLLEHYGKDELSYIHGLALSAWGIASVVAFIVSTFVLSVLSLSQNILLSVLIVGYAANILNVRLMMHKKRSMKKSNKQ